MELTDLKLPDLKKINVYTRKCKLAGEVLVAVDVANAISIKIYQVFMK